MEETLLLDLIQREPTGAPVLIFATEAERTLIATRLLASLAQMQTPSVASIPLRREDWDTLAEAAERLSESSIYFETPFARSLNPSCIVKNAKKPIIFRYRKKRMDPQHNR